MCLYSDRTWSFFLVSRNNHFTSSDIVSAAGADKSQSKQRNYTSSPNPLPDALSMSTLSDASRFAQ